MSRYDIYNLLDKEVKCYSRISKKKMKGICTKVYRNPLTNTIEIKVADKKFTFREPYKISTSLNSVILEYWDAEEEIITNTIEIFYEKPEEKPKRKRKRRKRKSK